MALDVKKHKRKRIPMEESVDIAPPVGEAKPERKKRRTQSKKDDVVEEDGSLRNRTERTPVQSETGANHVSDRAPQGDPPGSERKQKKKPKITDSDKMASSEKAEMSQYRKGPIVDERGIHQNSIETVEPSNDQAASNSSQNNDVAATTVKNAQKTKKRGPSTGLHEGLRAAPIDKGDLNTITSLADKSSKRKRKQKPEDVTIAADSTGPTDHETPQRRKRKHSEKNLEPTQAKCPIPTLEKKTSGSSRQDIYPNPNKDTELTVPALKALSYVHTHISSPASWKFNKARQNWVVRNLWDDRAIPDTYFPSCVKYVAGIRGNARDILIKSSKSVLDAVPSQVSDITFVDTDKPSTVSQGAGEAESSEEQLRQRQMRVKRAEIIVGELGIDSRTPLEN